jgi:hypothetical protein
MDAETFKKNQPEAHHVGAADQPAPATPLLNMPHLLTKGQLVRINRELFADNKKLAMFLMQQAATIKHLQQQLRAFGLARLDNEPPTPPTPIPFPTPTQTSTGDTHVALTTQEDTQHHD